MSGSKCLDYKKKGGKRNQHMGIISFWNDHSLYQD